MYVYDNRIILLSNVARVSKLIIMKILYHLRNNVTGASSGDIISLHHKSNRDSNISYDTNNGHIH